MNKFIIKSFQVRLVYGIDLEDIEIDEFDPKKLSLNVCDNEFFEDLGLYVNEIEYDQEWIDSSSEDPEGSYFNTNFHQS